MNKQYRFISGVLIRTITGSLLPLIAVIGSILIGSFMKDINPIWFYVSLILFILTSIFGLVFAFNSGILQFIPSDVAKTLPEQGITILEQRISSLEKNNSVKLSQEKENHLVDELSKRIQAESIEFINTDAFGGDLK